MQLADIQRKLGGEQIGEVTLPLTGVGALDTAGADKISFLANPKYAPRLQSTRAAAVILGEKDRDRTQLPRLVVANPYAYFARVAQLFVTPKPQVAGIHASAIVHSGAQVASTATVAEFCSIGAGAIIGEGAFIGPGSVIGEDAVIGAGSRLLARVTVHAQCHIGARALLHAGVVIGADGFGFAPDFSQTGGAWVKIPQTGRVVIGDDCEIGANTTIDRGAMDDTVIGNGVKIDNQVQIGHNCTIGDHSLICGCVGIAGSTRIGKRVIMGGASGATGHLDICDGAIVSAMTLVTKSIKEPGMYTGSMPIMKHDEWLKNAVQLRKLDSLTKPHKKTGETK